MNTLKIIGSVLLGWALFFGAFGLGALNLHLWRMAKPPNDLLCGEH
jgi:hypothetical protein